jgi:hypothetical protein
MHFVLRLVPVITLAAASVAASAADERPTLLGVARDWSAYQAQTGDGQVCYALSKPKTTEPKKAVRDPIYLLISDWPGRRVKGEFEIVPGYPYKDGEPAVAQVGAQKVEFFTRNDGGSGSAWVSDPNDEAKLLEAMRGGGTLVVSGVSKRGTHTKDTYSLSGMSPMLDKVHAAFGS